MDNEFSVEGDGIRYGLIGIKNMTEEYKRHIPKERKENGKYSSILNVLERMCSTKAFIRFLDASIASGLYDEIDDNRLVLYANRKYIAALGEARQRAKNQGSSLLFTEEDDDGTEKCDYPYTPTEEDKVVIHLEREYLGLYFRNHPLKQYKKICEQNTTLNLARLEWHIGKKSVFKTNKTAVHYLVCYVNRVSVTQKSGLNMYIGTAEDFHGKIRFIHRLRTSDIDARIIKERSVVGLVGGVSNDATGNFTNTFWVNQVLNVDEVYQARINDPRASPVLSSASALPLHIQFSSLPEKERLVKMQQFLSYNHGQAQVFLHTVGADGKKITITLPPGLTVNSSDKEFIKKLDAHPLIEKVWCE